MHVLVECDSRQLQSTGTQHITCSECKVQVRRLQEDLMAGLDEEATRDGVQYVLQCSKRLQVT
jgi:hypothetical protein